MTHQQGVPGYKAVYPLADALGSITHVVDAQGQLVDRSFYEPFGARTMADDSTPPLPLGTVKQGFTGHELDDALGFVNMKGRLYDATMKRFVSADPIVASPAFGQAWNPYSYVLNNPVNLTDPTGFQPAGDGAIDVCACPYADCSGFCPVVPGGPRPPTSTAAGGEGRDWHDASSNEFAAWRAAASKSPFGRSDDAGETRAGDRDRAPYAAQPQFGSIDIIWPSPSEVIGRIAAWIGCLGACGIANGPGTALGYTSVEAGPSDAAKGLGALGVATLFVPAPRFSALFGPKSSLGDVGGALGAADDLAESAVTGSGNRSAYYSGPVVNNSPLIPNPIRSPAPPGSLSPLGSFLQTGPGYFGYGKLVDGKLLLHLEAQAGASVRGRELFDNAVAAFGRENISGIHGSWGWGDNLLRVNELVSRGMPLELAAMRTWTAAQAGRHGFHSVTIEMTRRGAFGFRLVQVEFH